MELELARCSRLSDSAWLSAGWDRTRFTLDAGWWWRYGGGGGSLSPVDLLSAGRGTLLFERWVRWRYGGG
ncbi:hypothetical protein [Paenibacillus solanacearum]|uniref:hypothetical protein n=1 Tax=Paenibacillus solanacearum TaxID=2048548 RepID=UPI001C40153F|nr:hypothetical protein [Paenibacillus solanacearum]